MPFSGIPEALEDLRRGRFVLLLDDEDRENEGDLVLAAEFATADAVNFMRLHTGGVLCLALPNERADALKLPPMVEKNTSRRGTGFTISIEASRGVTTGISSADRATTIRQAVSDDCRPEDLVSPGHVFPLRGMDGGVLFRTGHTEGSLDLVRLAGLRPAAVISEVMNPDGTMARLPELEAFAAEHGIRMVTIADLVRWRMRHETLVRRVAAPDLPTRHGDFRIVAYESAVEPGVHHLALVMGTIPADEPVLVRVHSECLTGDVFGSVRCDCGPQLDFALRKIGEEGRGVVVYLRQEGRGIGLVDKLRAYEIQDAQGHDTVEANRALGYPPDKRDYGTGAQILRDLGVRKLRYMTNNPHKFVAIEGYGLEIVERVPIEIDAPLEATRRYLRTKKEKLGHLFSKV